MTTHTRICPSDNAIAKVCDVESTRYALGAVHVQPAGEGEVYLAATDSRCLAVVKCPGDVTGYDPESPYSLVPSSIFPKNATERRSLAYRPATDEREDATSAIEMNGSGKWETPFNRTANRTEGRFPRVLDVMPDCSQPTLSVCIDAKLLLKLSEALTDDGQGIVLHLHAGNNLRPSIVSTAIGVSGNKGFGVIMPISLEDRGLISPSVGRYEEQRKAYADADKAAQS